MVDFLGIGAQKSATTWLDHNLRRHPDVWLPPIKELHYFDRSPEYPSTNRLAETHPIPRLLGGGEPRRRLRTRVKQALLEQVRRKDWDRFRWMMRYHLGTYDDEWYLSLFGGAEDKVKGEITPSYSILSLADVQHIQRILPHLKIILLLRNPIERAWSHFRYVRDKGRIQQSGDPADIKRFMDSSEQELRSNYVRTIDNWTSCFPREQLFIAFYDDVVEGPVGLLNSVFTFLGVNKTEFRGLEGVREKVNVSTRANIPPVVELHLAVKYHSMLQELAGRIGGRSQEWLQECEHIVSGARG